MLKFAKSNKKQEASDYTNEANKIIRKSIEKISESSNSIDEISKQVLIRKYIH